MYGKMKQDLKTEITEIRDAGLYKEEWLITTPQNADIKVESGADVINFCANNYLGLSDDASLVEAAKAGLDSHGYGMSSVRFICGTQDIHKQLENQITEFLETEDTILYSSCFDANGGLFETLLTKEDAIISDQLNHASIIDGVRLCKAERHRYANADMDELEEILKKTQDKRYRMIATDGVFSMDGTVAPLKKICDLADKYDALVMVDDSHATGFMGKRGKGSIEYCDVLGRIDIVTSTLGKAMGGASGGFTSGRKEIVEKLRQRSRPYLFSNSLAPVIVMTAIKAFNMITETTALRDKLEENTLRFRKKMSEAGFEIKAGDHAIVPIMLGDAKLAAAMAKDMLAEGIYVVGFFFPVVPREAARIRVQLSAAHSFDHVDKAVEAFIKVGKKHGVLK
ncbi:MAG: glycine C-acetyltransferase [Deltaproteobacteria bacterium]|nr:glycine C-acetyltransferase [Deltaproteobacteria bacterium]